MMFTSVFIIRKLLLPSSRRGLLHVRRLWLASVLILPFLAHCLSVRFVFCCVLFFSGCTDVCAWVWLAAGILRRTCSHVRQSTKLCSRLIVPADLQHCLGEHLVFRSFFKEMKLSSYSCLPLPLALKISNQRQWGLLWSSGLCQSAPGSHVTDSPAFLCVYVCVCVFFFSFFFFP